MNVEQLRSQKMMCVEIKSDPQDLYFHWMIFIFIFWGAFISSSLHHLHLILLRHIIADIEPYLDHVRKISLIWHRKQQNCIIISASAANCLVFFLHILTISNYMRHKTWCIKSDTQYKCVVHLNKTTDWYHHIYIYTHSYNAILFFVSTERWYFL